MENKTPFQKFLALRKELYISMGSLHLLGINLIPTHNSCITYELNWQEIESICKAVGELGFFEGLTQEEELALALAVKQETQNAYIDESDIKTVNDFFDVKITFKMVQELNSKYI